MFLSRNALKAITDFQQEEENIMQLLEWIDKDQMDEERIMACIDVFNMVEKLLAKMMSRRKFKSKYDLLKNKCEDKGDQQRLSDRIPNFPGNQRSVQLFLYTWPVR